MCNKRSVGGDEMSVVDASIDDARRWGAFLLNRTHKGIGDTIERAAFEAEMTYGAPASILMRLWNRRDISDMKLSNWLAVKNAYEAACSMVERAADHQKHLAEAVGQDAATSRAFATGVLLGRKEDGGAAK